MNTETSLPFPASLFFPKSPEFWHVHIRVSIKCDTSRKQAIRATVYSIVTLPHLAALVKENKVLILTKQSLIFKTTCCPFTFKSIFFFAIYEESVPRKPLIYFSSVNCPSTQEDTIQFLKTGVEYLAVLINFNLFGQWMIHSVIGDCHCPFLSPVS